MKDYDAIRRGIAHMALNGWELRYGGQPKGTLGFLDPNSGYAVGVFWRDTIDDRDGELIGRPTVMNQLHNAPVRLEDVPEDIFAKLAKYTKVSPLTAAVECAAMMEVKA
jgi:hypothetical protein